MTLTKEQQSLILNFLQKNISFSEIIKECKNQGFSVSKGTLSNYKNKNIPALRSSIRAVGSGKKCELNNRQMGTLKRMISNKNPPTLLRLAKHFNTSINVIYYAIHKKLNFKLLKKPKRHEINYKIIKKRHQRSYGLYRILKCNNWKKYITVDEAWFYLSDADGQRDVQYISREKKRKDCAVFTKNAHCKGVMVFMGISYNGTTKPIFVDPGAKINSDYYIEHCLKPLIAEGKILYPNGDWKFHQDSAPAHTAKKTLEFLRQTNINFITPDQWTPCSPDLSPCDYFLWGYLKNQLNSYTVKNISQLKCAIKREVSDIPLEMLQNALKSWPKRCRKVFKNKGLHII